MGGRRAADGRGCGRRHHQPGRAPRALLRAHAQRLQLPPHHAARHGDLLHTLHMLRDLQVGIQ